MLTTLGKWIPKDLLRNGVGNNARKPKAAPSISQNYHGFCLQNRGAHTLKRPLRDKAPGTRPFEKNEQLANGMKRTGWKLTHPG